LAETDQRATYQPVAKGERIHVLDALRGFGIFGILMINILDFSGYGFMTMADRQDLMLAEWNMFFDRVHTVFFRGKFYSLFSLLFGIGFAIQIIRTSAAGRSLGRHFSRRLFILFFIGLIHLWAIWFGDILVLYAMCGMLLLLFRNSSDRRLLFWVLVLIFLLPGLHALYLHLTNGGYTTSIYRWLSNSWIAADLPQAPEGRVLYQIKDLVEVIQSSSWRTILSFNALGPLLRGYIIALDARFFKVLGIFVLGLWAGRQLINKSLHDNRDFLIRLAGIGLLIGIPMNILLAMDLPDQLEPGWFVLVRDSLTSLRYVILMAGYVAVFMLLYRTWFRRVLDTLFEAVGKTALTNYILQSVIGILLFYDIGLGLGKYFGSALLTLSVLVIFALQILLSTWWLNCYRYGPLEWIWRVLTYGAYLPNRIVKESRDYARSGQVV